MSVPQLGSEQRLVQHRAHYDLDGACARRQNRTASQKADSAFSPTYLHLTQHSPVSGIDAVSPCRPLPATDS